MAAIDFTSNFDNLAKGHGHDNMQAACAILSQTTQHLAVGHREGRKAGQRRRQERQRSVGDVLTAAEVEARECRTGGQCGDRVVAHPIIERQLQLLDARESGSAPAADLQVAPTASVQPGLGKHECAISLTSIATKNARHVSAAAFAPATENSITQRVRVHAAHCRELCTLSHWRSVRVRRRHSPAASAATPASLSPGWSCSTSTCIAGFGLSPGLRRIGNDCNSRSLYTCSTVRCGAGWKQQPVRTRRAMMRLRTTVIAVAFAGLAEEGAPCKRLVLLRVLLRTSRPVRAASWHSPASVRPRVSCSCTALRPVSRDSALTPASVTAYARSMDRFSRAEIAAMDAVSVASVTPCNRQYRCWGLEPRRCTTSDRPTDAVTCCWPQCHPGGSKGSAPDPS